MDLRRLQVFAKVYEQRSFSRAAEEVLLSQPTVSGHIKTLEEDLGVSLFDRLGREILPTRAAELLYEYAKRILTMVDEARRAVDAYLGRLSGDLLVGGSTIPGQYILPAQVGLFRERHPDVRINLSIGDTEMIAEQVLSGELELGVVGATLDDDRLQFSPLWKDEMAVAVWPDHPLAGKAAALADLQRWPVILREAGSGTRMSLGLALRKAGVAFDDFVVAAQMGSTTAVIQAVRARVGMGILSRRALADDLEAGRLAVVEVADLDLRRSFHLVVRKRRTHSPAAQAFIALLKEQRALDEA